MACTSMSAYATAVASMTTAQKKTAAQDSFDYIDGMSSSERSSVLLGLCSAAALYSLDITTLSQIDRISDLQDFVDEADGLDETEQFEAGLKAFFTLNYLSSTNRDTVFKGFYASADLSSVNLDTTAAAAIPGVGVGKVNPVW